MNRCKSLPHSIILIFCILIFYVPAANGLTIVPGFDLMETPADSSTSMDLSSNPIPADFFGPGSDPFDGIIHFGGNPLDTSPPGALGPADVVVKRTTPADLPTCGSAAVVDIEIVALSLVSIQPITVTYFGGQNPEWWDVTICLSGAIPQSPGTMLLNYNCTDGGNFTAVLPVLPKMTFMHLTEVRVLDFGAQGYPPIDLVTVNAPWTYHDPGFGVITSPGGVLVDHDCDGSVTMTVGAGSNFFAGLSPIPCTCVDPALNFELGAIVFQDTSGSVIHTVIPPVEPGNIPTLNEWGMIILAFLLLAAGTITIIRKRKVSLARI